jgi:hypothetical protein
MRKVASFVLPVLLAAPVAVAETLPQRSLPVTARALAPATSAVASDVSGMQEMVAPEPDILVMRINENGEREVACVHGTDAHRAFLDQGPQPKNRMGNDDKTGQE